MAPDEPVDAFPPVERALRDPDGLLAIGGDLACERLLSAYRQGIFPWFNPGQPVLWWSPDPRAVLFPAELHLSRSLRRNLKRQRFEFSIDEDFAAVIRACATTPRRGKSEGAGGTWITDDMLAAYSELHANGHAHSVEVRKNGRLVGGIYGVALGRVFFGESMFSHEPDASKAAMTLLIRELIARGFGVLDCQVASAHLATLGSREIPRREFLQLLTRHATPDTPARWQRSVEVRDLHDFDPANET
ncbi:MAG TPA: leucyl/phenylalanyl-tRNA--protein transferase, partial [Gammaproteobacteria bacterium]